MKTLKLSQEDILKGCSCLIDHLFTNLEPQITKNESQWYELYVDEGEELGIHTILRGYNRTHILHDILSNKEIQESI